jgi:hypothetical protein
MNKEIQCKKCIHEDVCIFEKHYTEFFDAMQNTHICDNNGFYILKDSQLFNATLTCTNFYNKPQPRKGRLE